MGPGPISEFLGAERLPSPTNNFHPWMFIIFPGISSSCPPSFVSNLHDIAASFQHRVTQQLANKLIRAIEYCRLAELITQPQSALVRSFCYIRPKKEDCCDAFSNQKIVIGNAPNFGQIGCFFTFCEEKKVENAPKFCTFGCFIKKKRVIILKK